MAAIGRGVEQAQGRPRSSTEHPPDHRANRRDRGALGEKDALPFRRLIDRERSERPRELEFVTGLALEQVSHTGAARHLVEANLDRVSVLRTRSDGIWPHARLTFKRQRDRDELAGHETEASAIDEP